MKPMLATPSTGASGRLAIEIGSLAGTHAFDLKLDGIRAMLRIGYPGEQPNLVNRNGVDISARFPDVLALATPYAGPAVTLDGEIMALDNSFESVLTRDKSTTPGAVARGMEKYPCTFFAFDVVDVGTASIEHLPWAERREILDDLQLGAIQTTPFSYDPSYLQQCREVGAEGVIAKRLNGRYQAGRRSPDWVKFKCLHRVTCIVTSYMAGTGSRSHFGAMFLSLIDTTKGELVPVGKVGTGFKASDIAALKDALDHERVLLAEIECLSVTKKDRQLRFPVWKGLRRDITPLDCTIDQLATIPTS